MIRLRTTGFGAEVPSTLLASGMVATSESEISASRIQMRAIQVKNKVWSLEASQDAEVRDSGVCPVYGKGVS
jgi:hypothetical protein